jgi:hypothetical protein
MAVGEHPALDFSNILFQNAGKFVTIVARFCRFLSSVGGDQVP